MKVNVSPMIPINLPVTDPERSPIVMNSPTYVRRTSDDAIDAAISRHHSALVMGPAGVGKTRVLAEATARHRSKGAVTLSLAAIGSTADVSFGALIGVLDPAFPTSAAVDDLTMMSDRLREHVLTLGCRLITVDDAHLLDDDTSAVLHRLSHDGISVVLSTPAASLLDRGALRSIARSASTYRLDLTTLSPDHLGAMARSILGGAVDGALAAELEQHSGGNPLIARELIRAGLSTGSIVRRRALWVLERSLPTASGLREVLADSVHHVDPDERRLVEIALLADPLTLEIARRLIDDDVLDRAEASGLIRMDNSSPRTIRVANVVIAHVVATDLPQLRRYRLLGELISAVTAPESTLTMAQRSQLGTWHLERGDSLDPKLLLEFARSASDQAPARAERFIRAAVAAGGGPYVLLQLARHHAQQQQSVQALAVLDSLDRFGTEGDMTQHVGDLRASVIARSSTDPQLAIALLDRRMARIGRTPALEATKVTALWRLGMVRQALTLADEVARAPGVTDEILLDTWTTAGYAAIYAGDRDAFYRVRADVMHREAVTACPLPDGPETVALLDAGAALMLGRPLDEVIEHDQQGYRRSLDRGDSGVRAQFAAELGWAEALRGDGRRALELLAEAQAATGAFAQTTLPWVLSLYIRVLAGCGRQKAAERILHELRSIPRVPVYDVDVALAEVAVLTSRVSSTAASGFAREAADAAELQGQHYMARVCLYAATSCGDADSAERLSALLPNLPTAFDLAIDAHARAVVVHDPVGLERAARQLADQNHRWHALDAQALAVKWHQSDSDDTSAIGALQRLHDLKADVTELTSPIAASLSQSRLTPREFQLARLAVLGRSDRAIAEVLDISIRTVQTHLCRIYTKLGVSGRVELGTRFELDR